MQQVSWLLHFATLVITHLCLSGNSRAIDLNNTTSESANVAKPGCASQCGNLTVPYPFGVGLLAGCSVDPTFDIICDTSFDPPKAFIGSDKLEVLGISDSNIRIRNRVASKCYDKYGNWKGNFDFTIDLTGTPFSISKENMLTVVGCDDVSYGLDDLGDFSSSCVTICSNIRDLSNGSCSGIGCCQASIPEGHQYMDVLLESLNNHNYVISFDRCGYSFLAEENSYDFRITDLVDSSFVDRTVETVPFLIDWEIGNQSCSSAESICKGKSDCVDSGTVLGGYRCNCSNGYAGNPYLSPGCQDINECEYNPCTEKAKCNNVPGSFYCSCPYGYVGDGLRDGRGCLFLRVPAETNRFAGLGIGLASCFLVAASFWLYEVLKKRRLDGRRYEYFKINGGLLLDQQVSADGHVLEKMKLFTAKELEKATDRFNESRILGRGGQGTVYKGMLPDGRVIAVKKSKKLNENQQQEFINEVIILSQVKHRNVVKLLGCCLDTEVPLLAYEFIPNGTLYDLIHDDSSVFPFPWDMRLRIAAEVARALDYLHYSTSTPVFHRDMKSNNVLLDEKYRAKVSDFGISRSVAIEQTHFTTKVKGTFGYLDPEYFQTSQFTDKSDVYSFGVILVELLTGQKPISSSTTEEERSLVTRFLSIMEENLLKTILDPQISEQGSEEEKVTLAKLAQRCLNLNRKKRPNMREVAMELERIRTSCQNPSFVETDSGKARVDTSVEKCIE
ncbi:wall-associated receptor kinase-like 8 [Henckelia pumila]|uniref:wall-associated receptor kinase-like 8 n=1 Tax=Henckelia pumila TaxID=405737 RepID=UPI003C6E0E38